LPLPRQSSSSSITLLAMTDQWIVVKDGSDENWLPRDKVMGMKASK
jgi:hypothetical protein